MMTAIITIAMITLIVISGSIAAWESYKDKVANNEAAIEWAKEMESKHNVNVALYEDSTGRIVDYKIYKL